MATPHNNHFQSMMSDLKVAHDFLKEQLPAEIQALIDWETLVLESNDFFIKKTQPKEESFKTDTLFSAQIEH